jgi:tetratricopeptide (TPR) repeat protein
MLDYKTFSIVKAMESFSADLSECYRILELTPQATLEEMKSAYRQLVKRYHPDRNPGDRQAAERFIQINQAYETLLEAFELGASGQPMRASDRQAQSASTAATSRVHTKVHVKRSAPRTPHLTPEQERLKQRSLELIFSLLQQRQWQQAARHLEGLASRLPNDPDLGKAQAKAYHGWARELLDRRRYDEARPYLQKAMKADPDNRSLWEEVERDYLRIERGLRL